MSWKEYRLDQLGSLGRGRSKHRPRSDPKLYGGETPFIQTADIQAAHVRISNYSQTYSAEGVAQSKVWDKPTLCLTIAGENTGSTAILDFPACFPDSIVGFVPDPEKANLVYIKHALDAMRNQFRTVSKGATQDNLSLAKILSFPLRIPPLPIQQKIASIVGAYDDLIENNLRRIALLEEAARLLYCEWFAHFRFPGHEHLKIIGGVPEGWELLPASTAFEINPATPRNVDEEILYVPMAALSETGMALDRGDFELRNKSTGVRFRNGDTLFARITPCLENGKTGFVSCLGDDQVACGSTEFIVLRGRRVSPYFAYLTARQNSFRENAIKSMIGSSGRQRVQESCFDRYRVPIAPSTIASVFDESVALMFEQIGKLDQANQKLGQARDLLLPRLMNGEFAV